MQMSVEDFDCNGAVIKMIGRLDLAGVQEIDMPLSLISGRYRKVIIDMSEVDFIASLGLRIIITTARSVANKGGQLVLASPQPDVANVLRVSGFDKLIPIESNTDVARASLA